MAGENCLLSVAGFGQRRVKVTRVTHGMSVVAYAGQAETRTAGAFYPSKRTSGSFEIRVITSSYREYVGLATWLEAYGRWAANPKTTAQPMRVLIPARDFDSTAVLKSGASFGDDVESITHTLDLAFMGSRDPMDLKSPLLSFVDLPTDKDPALVYLYPTGTQLKGVSGGFDLVEDLYGTGSKRHGVDVLDILYPDRRT